MMTAAVLALALAVAIIGCLILRVLWRLEWLLGSIESHSTTRTILAARREGIEVVWWDPTIEPWPRTARHGVAADVPKLRIGMPRAQRRKS